MLLRRIFQRTRSRSSNDPKKQTCLCTTSKRDSLYDDIPKPLNNFKGNQSVDSYALTRSDKPRRIIRQPHMDESDVEDEATITEKLRRSSSKMPANIPMLVVVSFNPDAKGLQKNQIEIHRGFPVNAQFIQNEWLYVRTADDDEGFVPYLCCRPMLRRQSLKLSQIDVENSYKPYDFDSSTSRANQSPSTSIPTFTPPINRKLHFQNTLGSQTCLLQHSQPCKKHQDVTSSCGGDSGFSDCESSTHHHHAHHRSFDLSLPISSRSSNVRSLRVSSNISKKNGLVVHDISSRKSLKTNQNQTNVLKSDTSYRTKSQLSISSNSAFTQFVKKSTNREGDQGSSQHQSSKSKSRLLYHHGDVSPTSSSISHLRRTYKSCDEGGDSSSPSTKPSSNISSPYIRRTPFARRSLPHHQPVLKKPLKPMLSSSPDPFQTINTQQQQLRHIVLAEPSIPPAVVSTKSMIERHFSDLSLNQIENDSLIPSITTRSTVGETRESLSFSSTSPSNCSSDESSSAFVHIHMNNSRCQIPSRFDSVPFVFSTSNTNSGVINHNTSNNDSNSFIHNVSITV